MSSAWSEAESSGRSLAAEATKSAAAAGGSEASTAAPSRGCLQAYQGQPLLAGQAEGLAGGDQDAQLRGGGQERRADLHPGQELLRVVQEKEHLPLREGALQLRARIPGPELQAEGLRDRRLDGRILVELGQRHEAHAVQEARRRLPGRRQGEAALANPAGAEDRDEPALRIAQHLREPRPLCPAAEEGRCFRGQAGAGGAASRGLDALEQGIGLPRGRAVHAGREGLAAVRELGESLVVAALAGQKAHQATLRLLALRAAEQQATQQGLGLHVRSRPLGVLGEGELESAEGAGPSPPLLFEPVLQLRRVRKGEALEEIAVDAVQGELGRAVLA